MSVFNGQLPLNLKVGSLVYADPSNGVYKIQPTDLPDIRENHRIAVVHTDYNQGSDAVKDLNIFGVGDTVLYIDSSIQIWGSSAIPCAIILCRIPVDLVWNKEQVEANNLEPSNVGEMYHKLIQQFTDKTTVTDNLNSLGTGADIEVLRGDKLISGGRESYIHCSSSAITVGGIRGAITVNGALHDQHTTADTLSTTTEARSCNEYIVNDTTLCVTGTYESLTDTISECTVCGKLAYGTVTTRLSAEGKPLATHEIQADGGSVYRSITGVVFEQTPDITGWMPGYDCPLAYDDKITESDKTPAPFSAISEDNPNWKKITLTTDKTSSPLDPDKSYTELKLTDSYGNQISRTTGKATFGFLPSGGFVIRDAWGSEIRMDNGDVQISAAKNIKVLSGNDTVAIVGGVLSTSATSGVNVGTSAGPVEVFGESRVSIASNQDVKIHANRKCTLQATDGIDIDSPDKPLSLRSGVVNIDASKELAITSVKPLVVYSATAMYLSAPGSAISLRSDKLSLAGSTQVLGDLKIGKKPYTISKALLGKSISISGGSGSLQVEGDADFYSKIRTSGDINCKTAVNANHVNVRMANNQTGVFTGARIEEPPRQTFEGFTVTTEVAPESVTVRSAAPDKFDIFSIPEGDVAFTVPKFCGYGDNTTGVTPPNIRVDSPGKTQYIYPGEKFWKTDGCYDLLATDKTIRQELNGDRQPVIGRVKLHKSKGEKK